jgi:L-ribulose-5-phosphate 4-epimerase
MMLEKLKNEVCKANLDLVARGLVIQTFGNVSGVDRESGLVVIKPSGVDYASMKPQDMVVVSLESGEIIEGNLRPSSDTPTHLVLYRAFPTLGGIVHTHSLYATSWAQAKSEIPALGTTHADYYCGPIPCTRLMRTEEIQLEYEGNTGRVIVERLKKMDVESCPGVLVASHGPFAWGSSPTDAVDHAEVVEYLARLASETTRINPGVGPMQQALLDKHFLRKHGSTAYYGQKKPRDN